LEVDGGDDGPSRFRFEISGSTKRLPYIRDGKDPSILIGSRDVVPEQMLHKTANRRQSAIAGRGRITSLRLDVIQEGKNGLRLKVV